MWGWIKDLRTVVAVALGAAAALFFHMWKRARLDRSLSEINRARAEVQLAHSEAVQARAGEEAAAKAVEASRHLDKIKELDELSQSVEDAATESRLAMAEKLNELFK